MAKFSFVVPPDFEKQLGALADVDRIAPKMLEAAEPILTRNIKKELLAHRRTAALEKSVKKTKTRRDKYGAWEIIIRPTGKDEKGVRNMEKLAYIEYGTTKQTPTPILTKALKDSEAAVLAKMQAVYNEEIKK